MRKDHRPLIFHRVNAAFSRFYAEHYLRPQFDYLGDDARFINPYGVEVVGANIRIGHDAHMMARKEAPICFTSYSSSEGAGNINIGNYAMMLPGSTFISADSITVGDNCMFASYSYLSDADWHGIYDRTHAPGATAPIKLGNNVWIGYRAVVGKGVTIGDNSVIGAGAIVTRNIPENVVAAGNPAKVVKELDPEKGFTTRNTLFYGEDPFGEYADRLEYLSFKPNTFRDWFRSSLWPTQKD